MKKSRNKTWFLWYGGAQNRAMFKTVCILNKAAVLYIKDF